MTQDPVQRHLGDKRGGKRRKRGVQTMKTIADPRERLAARILVFLRGTPGKEGAPEWKIRSKCRGVSPDDVRDALQLLDARGLVYRRSVPNVGPGRPLDQRFHFARSPLSLDSAREEILKLWDEWPPERQGERVLKLAFINWLQRIRPELLSWIVDEGHDRAEDVMRWLLEVEAEKAGAR